MALVNYLTYLNNMSFYLKGYVPTGLSESMSLDDLESIISDIDDICKLNEFLEMANAPINFLESKDFIYESTLSPMDIIIQNIEDSPHADEIKSNVGSLILDSYEVEDTVMSAGVFSDFGESSLMSDLYDQVSMVDLFVNMSAEEDDDFESEDSYEPEEEEIEIDLMDDEDDDEDEDDFESEDEDDEEEIDLMDDEDDEDDDDDDFDSEDEIDLMDDEDDEEDFDDEDEEEEIDLMDDEEEFDLLDDEDEEDEDDDEDIDSRSPSDDSDIFSSIADVPRDKNGFVIDESSLLYDDDPDWDAEDDDDEDEDFGDEEDEDEIDLMDDDDEDDEEDDEDIYDNEEEDEFDLMDEEDDEDDDELEDHYLHSNDFIVSSSVDAYRTPTESLVIPTKSKNDSLANLIVSTSDAILKTPKMAVVGVSKSSEGIKKVAKAMVVEDDEVQEAILQENK